MKFAVNVQANIATALRRSSGVIILLALMISSANAQSSTTGLTPPALTPGTPAGSYALSGFDSVNLFNGNLNFHLPLLNVGGRGGAQMPVVLKIEQRWRVDSQVPCSPCGPVLYPTYNWWTGITPGYGPGVMQGRSVILQQELSCPGSPVGPVESLARLTFTTSNGTEYELRDQLTNGQPWPVDAPCLGPYTFKNREKIFITSDGTSAKFISDTDIIDNQFEVPEFSYPTGILLLRDGTRYRIENGLVMWIQDRNGNRLTYEYVSGRVTRIIDSLGRQVTFAYDVQDGAPYGLCDRITYQGFGGATRIIRVSKTNLGNVLRSGFSLRSFASLFPELSGSSSAFSNPQVVSAVWLPDGRPYKFFYNDYAELARVELPTGGATEYDWDEGIEGTAASGISIFTPNIYRRVIERRVYPNGGTGSTYETRAVYSKQEQASGTSWQNLGYVLTSQYNSSGTLLSKTKHYFHGYGSYTPSNFWQGVDLYYTPWKIGREYQTEAIDFNGTTILRRETHTFNQREDVQWWNGPDDDEPPNDTRVVSTVHTLVDSNQVSKKKFFYDQFNNRTAIEEFDYGIGGPPTHPTRRTETDYVTTSEVNGLNYTADNIYLLGLPKEVRTYSVNTSTGALSEQAKMHFYYDQYTLVNRPNVIGYSAPATAGRGNLTSTSRWLDTPSGWITSTQKYDIVGNLVEATDANGNTSFIEYSSAFNAYAYPSVSKTPVPDPTGQRGSSSRLEMSVGHDFASGLVTSITDPNGNTTSAFYNDVLDRLTSIVRPAGGGQTDFTYSDVIGNLFVRTRVTQSASQVLETTAYFDGLVRNIRSSQLEGSTSIVADTEYEAPGRVKRMSNPYRQGDIVYWASSQYDALGRVVSVTKPGGAQVVTSFSGSSVTLTDEVGKARKTTSDALGRLVTVIEDPGSSPHLNLQTSYTYDSINSLRKIVQGSQTRYFRTDSLGRVIRVKNPEQDFNPNLPPIPPDPVTGNNQWSIASSYDNYGNLLARTDARNMVCLYTYDPLNRMLTRSYENDGGQTHPAEYKYDGVGTSAQNAIGRLTSISTSGSFVSSYTYNNFDRMGRVLSTTQTTDGQSYNISYEYDLAGNLRRQTYPSLKVVETTYDLANRISSVSSGITQYASSISYTPHGAVEDLKLGNNLWEHTHFNERLQPTEIGLGTLKDASDKLKLNYSYGPMATNNGNLASHTITIPGGLALTQTYTFDSLNRLLTAQENNGTSWKQTFLYDQYGNRTKDVLNTTSTLVGPNPSISSSTNRIATGQGYGYDAAGNLTSDAAGHIYGYNADNLQISYDNTSARYFYDGSNQRVKTLTDGGTKVTIFVYDAMGKLVAEYTNTASTGSGTSYLTQDILGSPRVVTSGNQAVIARHDYLPFGEEIIAGFGGRTVGQGYVADNVRQKFTGQQRDTESGLDYFNSRYYSSVLGRFTSADSFSGHATNPQSLNLYAYTQNNPLTMIDPTGHDPSATDDVDYDDTRQREYEESQAWGTEEWYLESLENTLDQKRKAQGQSEGQSDTQTSNLPPAVIGAGAILIPVATDAAIAAVTAAVGILAMGVEGAGSIFRSEDGGFPHGIRDVGISLEGAATLLQAAAQALERLREVIEDYSGGVTAVALVKTPKNGLEIVITVNNRKDPTLKIWGGVLDGIKGIRFARGAEGNHAEENLLANLNGGKILAGGTSRNVCIKICEPALSAHGLVVGGPVFNKQRKRDPVFTDFRMFWRK